MQRQAADLAELTPSPGEGRRGEGGEEKGRRGGGEKEGRREGGDLRAEDEEWGRLKG